ncbi:MAG TPA: hypothetical protein PKA98_21765, partial [Acidimicrobiales bacterium]|nr:hypothetical protein [Acidimicrobiales bacterium]
FELDIAETGRTTTAFEQWIARAEPEGSAGPSGPPRDDLAARLAAQVLGLDDVGLDRALLRTQVLPPSLVVVRHGGGWHVSPQYSAWETWRLANGIELPNFAEGPRAIGADTADAVVADLFGALERRDPGRIQSMVEPHENGALYHYVYLVLPTIEGAWSLIGTDPEAGALVVEHLTTEVEVPDPADGSRRRLVRITELAGTYTEGGRMLAFEYRDGCLEISEPSTGATTRRCDGDLDPTPLTDTGLDALFAWTPLGRTFPTFAVSEDRGRWFLSPTRTELFTLAEVLAGLEPEDLDQLELALRAYEERRDGAPTWPELSVLLGLDRPPRSRTQGSNVVDTAGGAPVGDPEVDQPDQPGG